MKPKFKIGDVLVLKVKSDHSIAGRAIRVGETVVISDVGEFNNKPLYGFSGDGDEHAYWCNVEERFDFAAEERE
jgi:hypothetical protein